MMAHTTAGLYLQPDLFTGEGVKGHKYAEIIVVNKACCSKSKQEIC